ncbi:unnamed protein product [Spirodela intermedia]|uniref:RanBD1 domain-containing protein n=1 Tax=Spirodela intermedia TaxID=51605 RepID=A0A7I8KN27_SPIIN|nr:unnamed protein product [Spirodela intermedia]
MGETEDASHPSKKRFAAGQLSRDNPGLEDDGPEPEMGTFQRASEEVLATRRIVKVRRHQPPSASTTSSNPFAQLSFPTPASSDVKPADADKQPPPASETRAQPTSEPQHQPSTGKEAPEADNGSKPEDEKTDEDEGIKSATGGSEKAGVEQNGQPDEEDNTQSEDKASLPAEESSEKDKVVSPKETSCSGEANDKEAENGQHEGEPEAKTSSEEAPVVERENKDAKETPQGVGDDEEKKDLGVNEDKTESQPPLSSFQQLSSSQNAFSGLAGTGFSASSFSFGTAPKEGLGSLFGKSYGPRFELTGDKPACVSFGPPLNLFIAAPSDASKAGAGATATLQEVPIETGEENERPVFSADAVLFEYLDRGWKERGKGELKVNISTAGAEKARLVMRARGNFRLILNASLYPDMSLTAMEKRGITFACVNSAAEGKGAGLSTFALKFKDAAIVDEFRAAVEAHKGQRLAVPPPLRTPENSPKASDE